jgi:hypothetical protein
MATSIPSLAPLASAATGAVSATVAQGKSVFSLFSDHDLEDLIFIVLGILLIAAGLFAFKTTQTIVSKGLEVGAAAGA